MRGFWCAALLASVVALPAYGHGGGGGGGGGHYVYIPVYGGAAVAMVPPAQTGNYASIHSVAVISAIGQTMTLGVDALLTKHSSFSIADWNFDRGVEDTVSRDLQSRFTVKKVAHDSAALAAIPNGHYDTSSAKAMGDYILALPDRSVDAFVVIRPDAEKGTPVTEGLSLDASDEKPIERANFEIDVVDAKTGSVIAHAFSRAAARQGVPEQFASFYGTADVRVMPGDTPTAAQLARLKKDFERNISLALRETLRSLNLGITLPEIGARTITPLTAAENPALKIPKVMIVSAIGDSVEVDHRGSLFSKRKDQTYQAADWGMDAEFEKHARDVLDKHFTPVTVPVDRTKLASVIIGDTDLKTGPVPGITPGTPGVDMYIVFAKVRNKANDNTAGLTLWSFSSADMGSIFSQYDIVLVEPKTGRVVFAVPGSTSPKYPSPVPSHTIFQGDLPDPGVNFSPFQINAAHKLFTEMMNDSIEETLLRLRLTGQKVEAGGADIAETAVDEKSQGGAAQASK